MSVFNESDVSDAVPGRASVPWAHLGTDTRMTPEEWAEHEARVALYEKRRASRLDLWTGQPLADLPRKELPVGALTALLRKFVAASRKDCSEDECYEDSEG